MTYEQASKAMRNRGFVHVAGNKWGKIAGRKIIYAYRIQTGDEYSIRWPEESRND